MTQTTSSPTGMSSTPRSPFLFGVNEVFNSWLPHGHEKALKLAFYNTLAIVFLSFILCAMIAVHFILEPFLRPLLWALLFGSALHPFKRKLNHYLNDWITDLKTNNTSITFGTILLPFSIINNLLDALISLSIQYNKLLLTIMISLPASYLLICHSAIIPYLWWFSMLTISITLNTFSYLTTISNTFIVMTIIIAYMITISFGWTEATKPYLISISPFVWLSAVAHLVAMTGTLGLIFSILFVCIVILGLITTLMKVQTRNESDSDEDQVDSVPTISIKLVSFMLWIQSYLRSMFQGNTNAPDNGVLSSDEPDSNRSHGTQTETEKKCVSVGTSPFPSSETHRQTHLALNLNQRQSRISNTYLSALLWAFFLVQLWLHRRLLYLFPLPIILIIIKLFCLRISRHYSNLLNNKLSHINVFFADRANAFYHPLIKNIYQYFLLGDKMIKSIFEVSLNALTSMSVICVMIICILFATVFMAIQIYGESLHLVNLMSNVVNKTLGNNPELTQLLPESLQGVHGVLDEVIKNAYQYGREYIKDTIRNALNVDGNFTKTKVVEKQILEIWDRAYHLWLIRNTNETESLPKRGPYDFDKLYLALKSLDLNMCMNILKENIDTVISVFESVWLVLKGNISLLFSAFAAVFSSLLGGGTAILNFFLNFVVFTTALFYLLSASGDQYKPVELVGRIFPSSETQQAANNNNNLLGSKFGRAVEEAINSVFAASLKMAAFYGIYSWLIHTLFEVNVIYIPSVIAAILGAVPFLGAYWASLPAILELWLVHGETSKAFLMIIVSILPVCFIDSTIYSEIKGAGHPYLTGLAIAGGVFYLGIEGALFGPLLLCCLFVAFNMYSSIMQESTTTSPLTNSESTPHSTIKLRPPQLKRVQSTYH